MIFVFVCELALAGACKGSPFVDLCWGIAWWDWAFGCVLPAGICVVLGAECELGTGGCPPL